MTTRKAAPPGAAVFLTTACLAALLTAFLPAIRCANAAPCGTLVIPSAIGQDDPAAVTSLNPLIGNSTYNQQSANLIYRPLIWLGQDGRADPDRSLAQSVQAFDHGTRYLVTLKPWLWSDGVPVTADDAVFTWSLINDLGPVFAYAGQGGLPDRIASVRAIDALHVEFRLKTATNPQWFELAGLPAFQPLPRHAWAPSGHPVTRDTLWQRQTDASMVRVVDGPFEIEKFVPDRYISYVPNPYYGGHQAEVARLVINFLEGGSALHALRAGDLDMAQVPQALWADVRSLPHTAAMTLQEPFGYQELIYNQRQDRAPFFRDARVRRALTDAADQKTIIDVVFRGASAENRVPIPAEAALYRSPSVKAGTLPVRSDPALAATELNAAGWLPGPDGVRAKDGIKLAFTAFYITGSDERTQMMQILQQNFRAVGVVMKIQAMDFNQLMATANGAPQGWDAMQLGTTLIGFPDGTGYFDTDGSANFGGYSNPRLDALIHASTDGEDLSGLFAYQDLFASEQPVSILPQGAIRLLVSDRVRGVNDFVNAQGFISPEYLSVADPACPVWESARATQRPDDGTGDAHP